MTDSIWISIERENDSCIYLTRTGEVIFRVKPGEIQT